MAGKTASNLSIVKSQVVTGLWLVKFLARHLQITVHRTFFSFSLSVRVCVCVLKRGVGQ